MKIVKIIFITLGILVALPLIVGLFSKSKYSLEKEVTFEEMLGGDLMTGLTNLKNKLEKQ